MKKLLLILVATLMLAGCSSAPAQKTDEELMAEGWVKDPLNNGYTMNMELPAPQDTSKMYKPTQDGDEVACPVGEFNTACSSINVDNLYEYLSVEDAVYIDLRDYSDYVMKHLKNFEVIPYFGLIYNAEAGTDGKPQLYKGDVTDPVAVYEESDAILNTLFPKDKTIFLMCQSGGRVVNMMKLLEAKGYDMSKIYNVGGMGQYTASEYRPYITDSAELQVSTEYSVMGTMVEQ